MKRVLDVVGATAILAVFAPLGLLIALAIRLETPGPVLFRQRRVGKGQVEFTMVKFRTMVDSAEQMGTGLFSYKGDPRVTRVGAVLRRTSLDEIPQCWNVIQGSMSLVGPRPPVIHELDDESGLPEGYEHRFDVKPGITGRAQVLGRNELSWPEKIIHDLDYIDRYERWGVVEDMGLLFRTIGRVLSTRGVIEERRSDQVAEGNRDVL